MSFLSNFIVLCAFFHGCVISDNIIKNDRKSVNRNIVYIENRANLLKSNECHGIIGCLIRKTSLNSKNALNHNEEGNTTTPDANSTPRFKYRNKAKNVSYPTGYYNIRTRSKRNTHERLFNYGSFYEEYPRYEGFENGRPWSMHHDGPPHEWPDYYERTHIYRENEPNARSLRRPPYGRHYEKGFSHHIEPRSSQFGNTRPDGARPWPQPHGDPPYYEPPPPEREPFPQRPPPPPYERRSPPPHGPPPHEPPPHGPPPHEPPPHGPPPHVPPKYGPPPRGFRSHEPPSFEGPPYEEPPQYQRLPISGRQFQRDSPPPSWEAPTNRKPLPRDGNNPSYQELAQLKDTSNTSTTSDDIDVNKNQENTDSAANSFMNANNKNLDIALVNNYQISRQTTKPYVYLFQAQPVTPEE